MKKFFLLSLSVVALIPVVAGTAVPAASSSTPVAQSSDLSPELIDALKAQAGSSLSRPL